MDIQSCFSHRIHGHSRTVQSLVRYDLADRGDEAGTGERHSTIKGTFRHRESILDLSRMPTISRVDFDFQMLYERAPRRPRPTTEVGFPISVRSQLALCAWKAWAEAGMMALNVFGRRCS